MGKGAIVALLLVAGALLALATDLPGERPWSGAPPQRTPLNTWSVVAADPASGAVGVAGASCFPEAVDAIAALVPGHGAAATQAEFDLTNRNRVFQLLQEGRQAEDIVGAVTQVGDDPGLLRRQYGVVTLAQGRARAATFTGEGTLDWAGARQADELGVAVQGNILEGQAVLDETLRAFRAAREANQPLPEQLLRALEAGSAAGGDRRCNTVQLQQTASAAFLMVARADEAPYAAPELGMSETGAATAPALYLSVTEPIGGENAVSLLREAYDAHTARVQPTPQPEPAWRQPEIGLLIAAVVTLAAMGLTVVWAMRRGRGEIGD